MASAVDRAHRLQHARRMDMKPERAQDEAWRAQQDAFDELDDNADRLDSDADGRL